MTRERKLEIWQSKGPFGGLRYSFPKKRYENDTVGETPIAGGITEAEDKAIHEHWKTLPGTSSYMTALWSLPVTTTA